MDLSFEKKELIIRKFMKGNFWNFINTLSNSLPRAIEVCLKKENGFC